MLHFFFNQIEYINGHKKRINFIISQRNLLKNSIFMILN